MKDLSLSVAGYQKAHTGLQGVLANTDTQRPYCGPMLPGVAVPQHPGAVRFLICE